MNENIRISHTVFEFTEQCSDEFAETYLGANDGSAGAYLGLGNTVNFSTRRSMLNARMTSKALSSE